MLGGDNIEIIIQILVGVLISFLSAMMINFKNKWEEERQNIAQEKIHRDKRATNIESALRVILGKQLDDMYSYYIDVGFIPIDKVHQARGIYDAYHSLGGNGVGTAEMNKLEKLPNNRDDIEI